MRFPFRVPKIEVFVRHCYYSRISAHKNRHAGFSHEKCYQNLMQTADLSKVHFTFILDNPRKNQGHFIQKQKRFPVIEIEEGSEARSFLALLEYVLKQDFEEETLIYFLEDDYLHKEGWADILLEGFSLEGVDYLTLFDHRDKYLFSQYQSLQARLFQTSSCHWRTTPSTTNTYAMRYKTLKEHQDVHREFSLNREISADHEKFIKLSQQGAVLISSIPGFSTHVEVEYASPCYAWEKHFQN